MKRKVVLGMAVFMTAIMVPVKYTTDSSPLHVILSIKVHFKSRNFFAPAYVPASVGTWLCLRGR